LTTTLAGLLAIVLLLALACGGKDRQLVPLDSGPVPDCEASPRTETLSNDTRTEVRQRVDAADTADAPEVRRSFKDALDTSADVQPLDWMPDQPDAGSASDAGPATDALLQDVGENAEVGAAPADVQDAEEDAEVGAAPTDVQDAGEDAEVGAAPTDVQDAGEDAEDGAAPADAAGEETRCRSPPETARIDRSASPRTSARSKACSMARRSSADAGAKRLECGIRPIATTSRTVKSKPIGRSCATIARRRAIRRAANSVRGVSSSRTDPILGRRTPEVTFNSVLFPEPFGPIKASDSPLATSRFTSRSAGVAAS